MPDITVLVPVHNGEDYLETALTSILGQSFSDFELLVINDGSTDRTQEIIEAVKDQRVRCVRHEHNRGLIEVLNEGLGIAEGKYIARMDADDVCHPQRLEFQHRFLEVHADIGVVGTAVQVIDHERRPGPIYRFPEQHDVIVWALSFLCPMVHPSIMMRRDLVLSAGGYAPSALHAEDYDLWERLSHRTRFANLPQAFLSLRKHGSSVTATEMEQHASTALAVSGRCIAGRIGRPVSEAVTACLMRVASCGSERASDAAQILLELYERFRPESEATRAIVRRDAAIRLGILAVNGGRGLNRLEFARYATRMDPGVWVALSRQVFTRLTGWGVQRIVG